VQKAVADLLVVELIMASVREWCMGRRAAGAWHRGAAALQQGAAQGGAAHVRAGRGWVGGAAPARHMLFLASWQVASQLPPASKRGMAQCRV
jgi:hypothetical protein